MSFFKDITNKAWFGYEVGRKKYGRFYPSLMKEVLLAFKHAKKNNIKITNSDVLQLVHILTEKSSKSYFCLNPRESTKILEIITRKIQLGYQI